MFNPVANLKKYMIGIITMMDAETLRLASKSVLPAQMEEIISRITAPIKSPMTAAIIAHTKAMKPKVPPSKPPPIAPILKILQRRANIPETVP